MIRAERVISFPASQSLHASAASSSGAISTGIPQLDEAIRPPSADVLGRTCDINSNGIPCGHVTEVYGPPALGKHRWRRVPSLPVARCF